MVSFSTHYGFQSKPLSIFVDVSYRYHLILFETYP